MTKETKYVIGIIITVIVIVGGVALLDKGTSKSVKYDDFAMCLAENGAKFYGAFWCPHCQKQKEMFEFSDKLPYVECSTPDAKGQLEVCKEAKVESYPTWIFADGTNMTGEVPLQSLAEKTGCTLPLETNQQ
jgi:thiol-disulfide isomerase/thioredoxin